MRPVALSIAGSDSGGGAGIQADLRVFSKLGVFGTTAITAVTAQNLKVVSKVVPILAPQVMEQIRTVRKGFLVKGVKTGMLWSGETIRMVAELAREKDFPPLVVDPVMVATSGSPLLEIEAEEAYRKDLAPLATLLTPNLPEAKILLPDDTALPNDPTALASRLGETYGCAVLVKGGHGTGDPVDVLWHRGEINRWSRPRVQNITAHGTGCMLSAAITAFLAKGRELPLAVEQSIHFVAETLLHPHSLEGGVCLPGIEKEEGL